MAGELKTTSSHQAIHIQVADTVLDAFQDGDEIHICLKKACDNLGLDYGTQVKKLKKQAWASLVQSTIVDINGASRNTWCVSLQTLPMWLATIHVGKVKSTLRGRLIAYQREAAKVLYRHFFGQQVSTTGPSNQFPELCTSFQLTAKSLDEQMQKLIQNLTQREQQLVTENARLGDRLTAQSFELANLAQAHTAHSRDKQIYQGRINYITLMGWCRKHGYNITGKDCAELGKQLTKKCNAAGINVHKIDDEKYGTVNAYPEDAVARFMNNDSGWERFWNGNK